MKTSDRNGFCVCKALSGECAGGLLFTFCSGRPRCCSQDLKPGSKDGCLHHVWLKPDARIDGHDHITVRVWHARTCLVLPVLKGDSHKVFLASFAAVVKPVAQKQVWCSFLDGLLGVKLLPCNIGFKNSY